MQYCDLEETCSEDDSDIYMHEMRQKNNGDRTALQVLQQVWSKDAT